jgi:hypothetical protein
MILLHLRVDTKAGHPLGGAILKGLASVIAGAAIYKEDGSTATYPAADVRQTTR